MKRARLILLLLAFIFLQCKGRNAASVPKSLPVEKISYYFLGIPDSLIKELPILPDDYFMTACNIMKEEGYEVDKKDVSEILRQNKGIIIPIGCNTFSFKRGEGSVRLFLSGKWSVSGLDYFILKCITDKELAEVFIFSVIDNAIFDSEWIGAINMGSNLMSDIGSVFICNDYDINDNYAMGSIIPRRREDTVYVCFFDTQKKLQEEHKYFLTKDGEIIFKK